MLLSMMTRFTEADVVVVGLIGERGREVGDFVKNVFGADTRNRTVVVAEPADGVTPYCVYVRLIGLPQ